MSRGKKLDIFIGADIEDGWMQVQSPRKSKIVTEILEPQKHTLVFKREKRRGKIVTLVGEFQLSKEDATIVLKSLKKKIGCGGNFKNGWMEFQGELQKKLKELLQKEKFRFKN
jgi:translation initiation factor 1